jgi:hypothetical protein
MQKGYHVVHKQLGMAGRIESFSSTTVRVRWIRTNITTNHELSELESNVCNKEHSMFKGLFCCLKPNHEGWCGCN